MRLLLGTVVVVTLLAINTTLAVLAGVYDAWPWFDENGIIETAQVVVLFIAFLNFLRLTRTPTPVARYLFAAAAIVCIACILRELDFEPDGRLGLVDRLLHGPVRVLLVLIAIPVFVIFIHHCIHFPRAIPRLLLGTMPGGLWIAGCVVVTCGALFDHELIREAVPHRWEELIELNGFVIMAMSCFVPYAVAERAIAPLAPAGTEPMGPPPASGPVG